MIPARLPARAVRGFSVEPRARGASAPRRPKAEVLDFRTLHLQSFIRFAAAAFAAWFT